MLFNLLSVIECFGFLRFFCFFCVECLFFLELMFCLKRVSIIMMGLMFGVKFMVCIVFGMYVRLDSEMERLDIFESWISEENVDFELLRVLVDLDDLFIELVSLIDGFIDLLLVKVYFILLNIDRLL